MGKVIRMEEETKDAIRNMLEEGMSARKISKHTKDFGRTVSLSAIYAIKREMKKDKSGEKQIIEKSDKDEDPRAIVKEIKELIDGLHTTYVETLRTIRADLIRARARLQEREGE